MLSDSNTGGIFDIDTPIPFFCLFVFKPTNSHLLKKKPTAESLLPGVVLLQPTYYYLATSYFLSSLL